MKVFAYNHTLPGVTLDDMRPYFQQEAQHAWELEKAGILRDNYLRLDRPTAAVMFETADVDEARRYISEFPMVRAKLIEFDFVGLSPYALYETAIKHYGSDISLPEPVLLHGANPQKRSVKVFAFSSLRPGVSVADIEPHMLAEARSAWSLYKAGIIRENYLRTDAPGEAFMLECVDIPEAQALLNEFPLVKAGLVEFEYMSVGPFYLYEVAF